MMNTLTILPQEEIRIIKKVVLISEDVNKKDMSIGYFFYERFPTPQYRLKEYREEDKDFDYYFTYPKQTDFPHDNIDFLILTTIQTIYPKSFIVNYFMVSSLDKENIDLLKQRPSEPGFIILTPDLSKYDYGDIKGRDIYYLKKMVTIFVDFKMEYIRNLIFYGKYDWEKENEMFRAFENVLFI